MGFEAGGTAEKLGNRYEGRWVVQQFLSLLAERLRSVQLEAVGDAEHGVDLWVTRLDGLREAQQCKAFNKSKSNWSISDLRDRDVLKKAQEQLSADHRHEFCFISTVLAAELEDLSRSARDGSADSESFYEHYVRGKPREKAFSSLCKSLTFDSQSVDGRALAFDFLRRCHVHTFQDDRPTRDHLELLASMLLVGASPTAAVASLAEIAEDNLHRELSAPQVVQLLERYGLKLRPHSADPSITARLEELREAFVQSIEPQLAAGKLIPRPETDGVLALLNAQSKPDAIVIHGAAGYGKSGALYQLVMSLRAAGTLVLAVRLDRKPPTTLNSAAYGQQLGLPGSPVATLCDVAAGQPAVLILDQLDALRWTNSHAEQGLDICKSLVREARAARSLGAQIDVILACRTFDLERDPEIRSWLNDTGSLIRIARIEVGSLSEDLVRSLISAEGIDPSTLGTKQIQLLQSVQRLAMWIEIVRSEATSPIFDSSTQLMRHFWANRRMKLEKAGCDPSKRDQIVAGLVEFMETNACLAAPARLLGNDQKLNTELQSCGVISIRERTVTFGHQANLDFLIAEKAVAKMTAEGLSVLQWIGPRDQQSLFRREQLRQVLFLLADEDHSSFLSSISLLLNAESVRFHLRQLALESLGQVQPQSEAYDYVIKLLDHDQWREHIQLHVIHGNESYISELFKRGAFMPMLTSSDPSVWRQAASWLWSLRRKSPGFVGRVCCLLMGCGGDWLPRVSMVIGHDGIEVETDELFALRLECLRAGSEPHYVNWDEFAKNYAQRAIQLYDAMLAGWVSRGAKRGGRRDEMHLYSGRERNALIDAARAYPDLAWKLLWPRLKWFISESHRRRRAWRQEHADSRYIPGEARIAVPASLQKIVAAAGRRLGRRYPKGLLLVANKPTVRRSRILSAIAATLLAEAPTSLADQILLWVLEDERRLHCGSGKTTPRWSAAAKLIRRMSPHCSDDVYYRLERVLLRFRDPEERKSAEYWLRATRDGYFTNGFGMGQYHLLPALDVRRRSAETISRSGVLNCKFANYGPERFLSRGGVGRAGWVRSPLDQEGRFERMSDKAWLRLITNERVTDRQGRWRHARGRSGFIESSVEMLSRSFGRAALQQPERFARLGLAFPANAPPCYLAALLHALARTKVPSEVPAPKSEDWRPASVDSTLRLLSTIGVCDDREVAKSFCWVVRDRTDLPIPDVILERLVHYAEHSEPEPEELIVDCDKRASECPVATLEQNTLNTVRTMVGLAIESILWRRIDLLPRLTNTINKLLNDFHPAVRISAIHSCVPAWNADRQESIRWLVQAVDTDSRIAASRPARELYNYAFSDFSEQLVPIVRAMVRSQREDVVEAGANQVAARWLFHGLFEEDLNGCMNGSVPQKRGIAEVATQLAFHVDLTDRCLGLIKRLLNDEAKEVRQPLSHIIYNDKFFDAPWASEFLTDYITSRSFQDDDSHLLWQLKELKGSIDGFSDAIFGITDVVVQAARDVQNPGERHWDVDTLIVLLLRLYERATGAKQTAIRQRCLDAWDELLKSRADLAWALTRGLNEA